jgi:glycine oxidase
VHVNPGLTTKAFAGAAGKVGAHVRQQTVVTGFARRGSVTDVSTNVGDIAGVDAVVLTAGSWSQALGLRLNIDLPVRPMRGQMIAYRTELLQHVVWGEDGYLLPKANGETFAGATIEDVGFRATNSARGLAGIQRMAHRLVPALRGVPVARAWAGLRPGSPDGFPIIGRAPGAENVYLATGHFRNGILLAPITGKLVSQLVLQGATEMDLAPFRADRFG